MLCFFLVVTRNSTIISVGLGSGGVYFLCVLRFTNSRDAILACSLLYKMLYKTLGGDPLALHLWPPLRVVQHLDATTTLIGLEMSLGPWILLSLCLEDAEWSPGVVCSLVCVRMQMSRRPGTLMLQQIGIP